MMKIVRESLLDVYRHLQLKPAVKGIFVTELASDVKEMISTLTEQGISPEKAETIALETLAVSDQVSTEISRLHMGKLATVFFSMSRSAAVSAAVMLLAGALLSLRILIGAGGIGAAAGVFAPVAILIVIVSLILFAARGREVFLKNRVISSFRISAESSMRILAVTMISVPFLIGAVNLAGLEPELSVHWLRNISAMLSVGLISGIFIAVMLILIRMRQASLTTGEKKFTEILDSILEERT